MNRFAIALVALSTLSISPGAAAAESEPGPSAVVPQATALMTLADAQPPVGPDCWECHECPGTPEDSRPSAFGISTLKVDIPFGTCIPDTWCEGCDPNEEDADAELALTDLIESEGADLIGWMNEYQGEFALTLIGSTLQISRECGTVITWLALSETDLTSATKLLDQ